VTKLLIRASKTPFNNFYNGAIPQHALKAVHDRLDRVGTKNIGNLVFAHSAYKVLSAPGVDLSIDDYALTLSDSYADQVDEINERYDTFVLPLCNSFRLEYKDTLARMTRTIRKLRIPCVVTGVGAQVTLGGSFDELAPMATEVKDFVGAILDRSESIGVRGEITRDYLVSLGFSADRVDVIGCPSMFYNGARMNVRKPATLERIAVNLTTMDDPQILKFAAYFNDRPENVTYVPQVRRLMPAIGRGDRLWEQLATPERPTPNLLRADKIAFLVDVVPWIDFMRSQSLAIGTRIHGNIVALLAGTPAHVMVHDSRTFELAQHFDIPHTLLRDIDEFDLRRTFEQSDYTALNTGHGRRTAIYAAFLERNGLAHVLYDNAALDSYDQRLRDSLTQARLPAPVRRSFAKRALSKLERIARPVLAKAGLR